MLRPTPGDPWGVEHHHWNTGAEENQQLNPGRYLIDKCHKWNIGSVRCKYLHVESIIMNPRVLLASVQILQLLL